MNVQEKGIAVSKDQKYILAHLIQGIEAKLLEIVCELHGDKLCLLQHDGFTAVERLPSAEIEAILEQRTGFRMSLSEDYLEPIKSKS